MTLKIYHSSLNNQRGEMLKQEGAHLRSRCKLAFNLLGWKFDHSFEYSILIVLARCRQLFAYTEKVYILLQEQPVNYSSVLK